jgi:hypothetical protein
MLTTCWGQISASLRLAGEGDGGGGMVFVSTHVQLNQLHCCENRALTSCAGTLLPRRHKCVAQAAAVLSLAFMCLRIANRASATFLQVSLQDICKGFSFPSEQSVH